MLTEVSHVYILAHGCYKGKGIFAVYLAYRSCPAHQPIWILTSAAPPRKDNRYDGGLRPPMADYPTPLLLFLAPFKPSLEGRLALAGVTPGQETFDTDIFVQVFPMNALPFAYEFPVSSLFCYGMQEPGIPA